MNCKNCGKPLNPGEKFCANCGAKVEAEPVASALALDDAQTPAEQATAAGQATGQVASASSNDTHQVSETVDSAAQPSVSATEPSTPVAEPDRTTEPGQTPGPGKTSKPTQVTPDKPLDRQPETAKSTKPAAKSAKSKNTLILVLAIIGGLVIALIAVVVIIILIVSANTKKMTCKVDDDEITITYNESEITGYTAKNFSYDLDDQKEYAKEIGVDQYLSEFNEWFTTETSGVCKLNGKEMPRAEADVEDAEDEEDDRNNESLRGDADDIKVVGDEEYGYIDIPGDWVRFYDIDGNSSLQYSYSTVYIVTLNHLEDNYTAKEYASTYLDSMRDSDEVRDVTGATVKVGKNQEYTAYQVSMYYPADNTYLITYWFDTDDGKVRYIALEGPEQLNELSLADFLFIPESFRLTK